VGLSARRQPCLVGKETLKPPVWKLREASEAEIRFRGELLVIHGMMGIGYLRSGSGYVE
jgi:hypothetical protein